MNESTVRGIFDLLVRHEAAMSDLYQMCASLFPEAAEFWRTLVLEEKAHADVLGELAKHLLTDGVYFNEGRFNVFGIQTAIDHIDKQKHRIESGSCTLRQAIAIALDIERAMIDRDAFHVFETDSPMMKREFEALKRHTSEHIARISAKLSQLANASAPS